MLSRGTQIRLAVLAACGLLGIVVLFALVQTRQPAPTATPAPIVSTVVAATARAAVVQVQAGEATQPAVVAGEGLAVTNLPPTSAPASPAPAGTTPTASNLIVDPMRAIAVIALTPVPGRPSLQLGDSTTLIGGDQLLLAPGTDDAVSVSFVQRATVQLGTSGLSQIVLELALPPGTQVERGVVLDGEGRLVGIVAPERQTGVPPGHVYAVPVEQVATVLRRAQATATP